MCIVALQASALYFQHVMDLLPCVMCIYERVAMMGVGFSAILGALNPKNTFIRWIGFLGWGASAYQGLTLSLQHIDYQFNPSPFATCDIFVSFPDWAPLNEWLPSVFEAYGDCSKIVWQFFTLSMPQWLFVLFAGMLTVLTVVVISQFAKKPTIFN